MSNYHLVFGYLLAKDAPTEIRKALNALYADSPAESIGDKQSDDIAYYNIPVRILNRLHIEGITKVSQLRQMRLIDLLRLPNMGRKSIARLESEIPNLLFPANKWAAPVPIREE